MGVLGIYQFRPQLLKHTGSVLWSVIRAKFMEIMSGKPALLQSLMKRCRPECDLIWFTFRNALLGGAKVFRSRAMDLHTVSLTLCSSNESALSLGNRYASDVTGHCHLSIKVTMPKTPRFCLRFLTTPLSRRALTVGIITFRMCLCISGPPFISLIRAYLPRKSKSLACNRRTSDIRRHRTWESKRATYSQEDPSASTWRSQ